MNTIKRMTLRTHLLAICLLLSGSASMELLSAPRDEDAVRLTELLDRVIYRSPRWDAASYDEINAAQQRIDTQDMDSIRKPLSEVQTKLHDFDNSFKGLKDDIQDCLEECCSNIEECYSKIDEVLEYCEETNETITEYCSTIENIDFVIGDTSDPAISLGPTATQAEINNTNASVTSWLKTIVSELRGLVNGPEVLTTAATSENNTSSATAA